MISFYKNFHNINKMSAIFVSSALRRVELVLFSRAPLPYAIRTPRNIHVVTEGEKTTSLPSKLSLSSSFPLSPFFLSFSLLRPFYTTPLIIRRCRAAAAACSIENGIISGRPLILPRFAVVANGEKAGGNGGGDVGDETER